MDLYLLRHGEAAARDACLYPDDAQRPLTAAGKKQMGRIAKGMRRLGLDFDLILSSPYQRARQTAAIVAREFGAGRLLESHEQLVPQAKVSGWIKEIQQKYDGLESLLLVGHDPFLSCLVSFLLAGTSEAFVSMKKAGLCKLEVARWRNGPCAVLKWLLTPQQIQRIAKG